MRIARRAILHAMLIVAALCAASLSPARADEFAPEGLSRDSDSYADGLTRRFPAGGTPAARMKAEQQAADAVRKRDWGAAADALETRIGLGNASPAQWMMLAEAAMRRTPPDTAKAVRAAWQSFTRTDTGPSQIPALLLMADAWRAQDRPVPAMEALQAALDRAPEDARLKQMLADARLAAGMLVRRVATEPEADPPRACIAFSTPPDNSESVHPADWVRLDPPLPDAAVTREGNQLCVSGLPSGRTTAIVLRAGLPGTGGLTLRRETALRVAMPDRAPSIAFDQRLFILPHGQAPVLTLTTMNLSSVKLSLARLTERTVVPFLRSNPLGQPIDDAEPVGENGRVVWEGRADIPRWTPNRAARTALPVPEALAAAPGLYALTVRAGDGTPAAPAAVQMILRTDLAPTVWRGTDGLTVQVRSYGDAKPRPGVRIALMAADNDALAETTTDAAGVGRFAAPLLRGTGPLAPRAIHLFAGEDFAALDLDAASFDLSDRGVSGQPDPGPLDAFVWLDRGIYRPGETVQVMALLRDDAGAPVSLPAHVILRRPNGQVFSDTVPPAGPDASVHLPVTLSAGAAAGVWSVEVRADPQAPPIGRAEFRVDAFVPDRMAVEFGAVPGPLVVGTPLAVPVTARFLYGAPGAGLSGRATMRLVTDPQPFPALEGFATGLAGEIYAPDSTDLDLPDTDAQGRTTLTVAVKQAPDTTHALKAAVTAEVSDPSGHAAAASAEIKLRPAGPLIGIKPLFAGGAVDAGGEAAFDVIAVAPDGTRMPLNARLRLVRERPDWRLAMRGGSARYELTYKDEPLETQAAALTADAPLHFAKSLGFGRYRLEVLEAGGLAATSVRFRAGWVAADNPDVPDQVDVSVDRAVQAPGNVAHVHIAPPFAGEATLLVLSDRVHVLRTLSVPEGGTTIDVPVDAAWGPGAYVAVHLYRPSPDPRVKRPARAIGLVWVGVDPAARTLPVALDAAEKYPPRARAEIPVRTAPGAWATVAAVDEGILRLTRFASPDPVPHFLGRRRLGLDIRDDWGRLIAPGEGDATLLRQGGDEGGNFALPDVPQHTVTLFAPPVQAGADGIAHVSFDFPDFAGEVRLMAVSWSGNRIGAASKGVLVRDPLVAEPLLPRFLAPEDEARMAVLLHNLELPAGEAAVDLSVSGPLRITGPQRLTAQLAQGAQAVPATTIAGTGAGRGVIRLLVTGPGGFRVEREAAITVRPSRGPVTSASGRDLAPGQEATLDPGAGQFLPGTWRASASFGGAVRYDAAALVRALDAYPLNCLEQIVSRGVPLVFLPDGATAGPDRAGRLQAAVGAALDRQRYDGAFGLWSSGGEAQPWLSAYATEFLLRARQAGAAVPDQALDDALKYLREGAESDPSDPEEYAAASYRLYVLALAGHGRPGAARVLAERSDRLPTPLARAQVGAALALAHEPERAEAAFRAALNAPARRYWAADYGSALRDAAATAVLLKESGVLPERMPGVIAALPGADLQPSLLSTQEQAWAAAAAGALGRGLPPVRIAVDGRALPEAPVVSMPLANAATVRNLGERAVWQTVSASGVPAMALPASRNQMRISRKFMNLDGQPLDLDHLRQNSVFVLLLEGEVLDGQEHQTMVLHGLPAGWEIAGRLGPGAVPGMAWLGTLSDPDAVPAADDRFAAVLTLTQAAPAFRLAVRIRAVTPGSFGLPGAEAADMYRPAIFARQNAGRITVLAAE